MAAETYTIKGTVLSRRTGSGIGGLKVEAWDKDFKIDDRLGVGRSAEDGRFEIELDDRYVQEICVERKPDVYFKVCQGAKMVCSTEDSVVWNADAAEKEVRIPVDMGDTEESVRRVPTEPLTINDRGEHVRNLHQSLVKLGYSIPDHELREELFGAGTRNALLAFQKKCGLRCSGKLDDRTEAALIRAVGAAESGKRLIEGRIYSDNGLPAAGVRLRFYRKGFGGVETRVGKARTDGQGFYALVYDPDGKGDNVEVRCRKASGEEISLCETKHNLDRYEMLNLVVPTDIQPPAPEYDRLRKDLRREIGRFKKLAEATETEGRRDLTFLHHATGWDARIIALAATAVKLSLESKVPRDFLYALFRAGLPTDKQLLCMVSEQTLDKALNKAMEVGIVALDDGEIAAGKKAFQRFAKDTRRGIKAMGAPSTFGELLAKTGLSKTEKEAFEDIYFSHRGEPSELWEKAEERGISRQSIRELRLQGKLAALTHNNAALVESLQTEIGSPDNLAALVDQDFFKQETWETRITALAGGDQEALAKLIPPAYSGEKTEQRLALYAADSARKVRRSWPTQVVRRMVETRELTLGGANTTERKSVSSFLEKAAERGFRLGRTSTGAFIKQHGDRIFADMSADEAQAAICQIKRLHRLYQVTPSDASLTVLDRLGFSSAEEIAAFSQDDFMSHFGDQFPDEREVQLVWRKAQQVHAITLSYLTTIQQTERAPIFYGISGDTERRADDMLNLRGELRDYPTMESLFGSLDFCECEHCRSVLSPAAYFVDLLQFLDPDEDHWRHQMSAWRRRHDDEDYTDSYMKPYDALTKRRADVPHLALTCENTLTALPYIDVVNEILEYSVLNDELSEEAVHNTGKATTQELLTEPHHILPGAYNILRDPQKACYPLTLPFDLWLETVRGFLDHFETPLWRVLEVFRKHNELFSADDQPLSGSDYFRAAVFAEYLGISPAEYGLYSMSDSPEWYRLYGYGRPDDPLQPERELRSAKTLSRRLEISYKELTHVVMTNFVNPELENLSLLYKLGVDASDAVRYLEQRNEPGFAEEKKAFEDRIRALLQETSSKRDLNDILDEIEALQSSGSLRRTLVLRDTSGLCSFDDTYLAYTDPDGRNPGELVFLKINLFVRLWKKLGWSIEETDRALQVFLPTRSQDLTEENIGTAFKTVLVYLAHLKALDEMLDAGKDSRLKLLTLWSELPTTGQDPLYARLFLSPSMLKIDPVFDDPLGRYLSGEEEFLKNHLPCTQAALGLTADEVALILTDAGENPDRAHLTLANVSLLYRYRLLADSLKLPVNDLIVLKELSGLDPFTPLSSDPLSSIEDDYAFEQTLRFVEVAGIVKESGFSVEDLDYLLRHRFDAVGRYRDDPPKLLALLKGLGSELYRIREEHAVPADPNDLNDDVLREKLALVLPPDVAETFHTMWTGSIEYEAVRREVLPKDSIDPKELKDEPKIVVRYDTDREEQHVIFQGVLLAEERARLEGICSSLVFSELLDSVQAPAKTFFETHLQKDAMDPQHSFGFLKEGDFELLFEPIPEEPPDPDEPDPMKRKRETLAKAFLPFLQERLARRLIVQTLASDLGGEPELTEALLADPRLLSAPGEPHEPLLAAFEGAGDRGVGVTYWTEADPRVGVVTVLPTADTGAKDPADSSRLLPDKLAGVRFEGYLEVPADGGYRFFARRKSPDAEVELRFSQLPDPLPLEKPADPDTEPYLISPVIELKAGLPYHYSFHAQNLDRSDVALCIQGETLPEGQLSRLTLYPQSVVDRIGRARILLTKAWQIIQGFELNEREMRYLLTHPQDFDGLDLRGLPTYEGDASAAEETRLFGRFLRLAGYVRLRQDLAAGQDLIDVFENARCRRLEPADVNSRLCTRLAEITRRDPATVQAAAEHLGYTATPDESHPDLLVAEGFTQELGIGRIWEILQVVQSLGVSFKDAQRWATPAPDADTARDLRNTVKARHAGESWQSVAQPIFDRLRARRRDALVAYIMHDRGFESVERLFEHFLIDPGMEPVVQTSRIQLAISSVQLFIQRCLLNLEPKVPPSIINSKHWQWMKRYRVWEANRKIFLFPENWLEPEFRDDKTHLFRELESAMLQGDVSQDLAEDAFLTYLKGLETISRLEIVSMYREEDPFNPESYTLHVIGRTYNNPQYFYRRYSNGMWTPWEPVTAQIEGDHVAAVVWRQRLHLFWVTFLEEMIENPDPREDESSGTMGGQTLDEMADSAGRLTVKTVKAQLNWCEYFQGKWTTRESAGFGNPVQLLIDESFNPADVHIHATKGYNPETGAEQEVKIHLWGNGLRAYTRAEHPSHPWLVWRRTAFRVVGKNSSPDVIPREYPQVVPYATQGFEATKHKAVMLSLTFEERTLSEGLVVTDITQPIKDILRPPRPFTLLFPSNLADVGLSESEKTLSEFFFQDHRNTFFVDPMLSEIPPDGWEGWAVSAGSLVYGPEPDPVVVEVCPAHSESPPREPEEWEPALIDSSASYPIQVWKDWGTDPATVVKFEGTLIRGTGGVAFEEPIPWD